IITGDATYLEPYRGAAAGVQEHLGTLRQLTADNPLQQARLDTLAGLVLRRIAALDHRILARRRAGFDSVRVDFLKFGGGRPVMDSARAVIAEMNAEETGLLTTRMARQQSRQRAMTWVVWGGTATGAVLALLVSGALSRYAGAQTKLAGELRDRSEELETANEKLQDQAMEVEVLNEELQATNEELQGTNEQL